MKVLTHENFEAAGASVKKAERVVREMYDELHAGGKATNQDLVRFGKLLVKLEDVQHHIQFCARVYFLPPEEIDPKTTDSAETGGPVDLLSGMRRR